MNVLTHYFNSKKLVSFLIMLMCCSAMIAQSVDVTGTVIDSEGYPIIGATVISTKDNTIGAMTDIDGKFYLKMPLGTKVTISYLGMKSKEITITKAKGTVVTLEENTTSLDEVVVVGFGQQKKASVVGAITQATGETLERAAGLSDIGSTLTGNLPGVITTASTGMPGAEDPKIVIRGASSWNNSSPLVLVDGIERPMSSVDVSSVENISVLKDASATAVYGVKGANGVILITTKRGQAGKAQVNVMVNSTLKAPSYLPNKMDSYDGLMAKNKALEHELGVSPDSWYQMTPQSEIEKYRNPTSLEMAERYPNVDWQDVMFKDFAMAYNFNINVAGGTDKVKYFASIDYQHEGDLFEQWDNGRGYNTAYTYDRINARSNLDYQLTKTTKISLNLAGSTGVRRTPWGMSGNDWEIAQRWSGAYNTAPDAFLPVYADGSFGFYPKNTNIRNPIKALVIEGDKHSTTTTLNSDFVIQQDLDFITKGLSLRAAISWDNVYVETDRGINDDYHPAQEKYVDPETGLITYYKEPDPATGFEFNPGNEWAINGGYIQNWTLQRRLFYQGQINYNRTFGSHTVTAMGVFNRQEYAWGSQIPQLREDLAFRATYNYANRYFVEYNGAYNGSEKFASHNRYAFFNSGALGWTITEEKFMQPIKDYLSMLKVRVSYGEIGDDNTQGRWLYQTQWDYGKSTAFWSGQYGGKEYSPYIFYREGSIGNNDVHWETVQKFNAGLDYSLFDGLLAGSVDVFRDYRYDILINGDDRSTPFYFGATPSTANLGEMSTHGYEIELRLNKSIGRDMHVWGNFSMTHATNEIINRDDPELKPAYQKQEGYALDQNRTHVDAGSMNTYDQIYGGVKHESYSDQTLPGDKYIIDYNCDGIIDSDDAIPYGYTGTPQNTYNATVGFSWKGWSIFAQFYGVTNVNRDVYLKSFDLGATNVYDLGEWWSPENTDAQYGVPRFLSTPSYNEGTQFIYDGSYVRLKNAEIAYTFDNNLFRNKISNLRIYVNGNNLWVWSRMPDDRESNFAGGSSTGAYPTMRRINFGVKMSF